MCCVFLFSELFCIKAPLLLLPERIKDAFVFHPESAQRADTQERMKLSTHVIYKTYTLYTPRLAVRSKKFIQQS